MLIDFGALGGTRTPTMLLTATSRQRVYQFRHERLGDRRGTCAGSDQDRINGADVTNQGWRDKACRHRGLAECRIRTGLASARQPRQHSLDFNRNTVAIDKHYPAGDRQVVGEDLDLVRLGSVQLDDGAAAQPHYLMDGHRGGAEDHHEVDADFIEGWHWGERPELTKHAKLRGLRSPRYG